MEFDLKKTLMALLVSTNEPLSIKDIQAVITRYHDQAEAELAEAEEQDDSVSDPDDGQGVMRDLLAQVPSLLTSAQIRDAMDSLASDFVEKESVMRLSEGPNGYRLAVAPQFADWVRLLRDEPRPQRLSAAAMETLAIIAYRQPVTRAEIEAIRGVSADSALNKLLEKELVFIVGRAELPGRPLQYATTDQFLEYCGIKTLEELPSSDVLTPNQISEWIRTATMPDQPLEDEDMGLPGVDEGELVEFPANEEGEVEEEESAEAEESVSEPVAAEDTEDGTDEDSEEEPEEKEH